MLSLRILPTTALPSTLCSPPPRRTKTFAAATSKVTCNHNLIRDVIKTNNVKENVIETKEEEVEEDDNDDEEEKEKGISRIQVHRQKYIQVSKTELLNAIVSLLFEKENDDVDHFLLLSSCLDSILHAEHKIILERMRTDYISTQSSSDEESVVSTNDFVANGNSVAKSTSIGGNNGANLDFRSVLNSSIKRNVHRKPRIAVATRFQHDFMQLLRNAEFEELSPRDLVLTSALNTDYLLTLPVSVDWERAYESNAIIFRRGYTTERQTGLLIVEKLDYVQSKLLQGIFSIVSKPLGKVVKLINEVFNKASQTQETQDWILRIKLWLKKLSVFQQSYLENRRPFDDPLGVNQQVDTDLPIWLAAQKAVSRYEGFLSPVGPRKRLFRKLLAWIGLIPAAPETPYSLDGDSNASEPYLRPIVLSRMTLDDIWKPATKAYCGNDVWKRLKTSVSILLSPSTLQEPSFKELILLYTNEECGNKNNAAEEQSLQLKIFERIPIPDLPVIFPHKKLYFRIIDTVRLDATAILGLLAYFINYKFEDIVSSPSAVILDVVAISALIIFGSRVALGYKQTWDRYQLLVNKTLYEKTLASGFGSIYFLLDASEQQQFKEAILTYAILLKMENSQVACHRSVGDNCERFLFDVFKEKVEMPVDKAISTLARLGLVTDSLIDGRIRLQPVACAEAYGVLKERWNSLLL